MIEIDTRLRESLDAIKNAFDDILVILAPPRSASTALARVFWQHPSVDYYSHEPFDLFYHKENTIDDALNCIKNPLLLGDFINKPKEHGRGILIKEMTFQVDRLFSSLVYLSKHPIIFIIRDPRLSIHSRLKYIALTTKQAGFPVEETGWLQLWRQIKWCRENDKPYVLVESTDFRRYPAKVMRELFKRLDLSFSEEQLAWERIEGMRLGNLNGAQDMWYERVLGSTAIEVPDEIIPDIESFSPLSGLREHVIESLELYHSLLEDSSRVSGLGSV